MHTAPMTLTREDAPEDAAPLRRRHRWRKLTVHYVEMVIAMAVGMVALHPVWTFRSTPPAGRRSWTPRRPWPW